MNVFRARTVALLATAIALLLFQDVGYAQAGSAAQGQKIEKKSGYESRYLLDILLDANQRSERQLAEAGKVEALAEAGDAYAQYLLGTLYRLGKSHPSKLFERDDGKAEKYLGNASVNGQVLAMAGMAELELRRKQPMKAMVWAQAFAGYQSVHDEIFGDKNPRQAYAAFLLQRSFEGVGHSDAVRQQIGQYFQDFQESHDATIRAAIAREHEKQQSLEKGDGTGLAQLYSGRIDLDTPDPREQRMHSPGYALFLVGINPKGRIEKLLVVDALPDQVFAAGLEGVMRRSHFNTAKKDSDMRWAYVPVNYDDQSVKLKKPDK